MGNNIITRWEKAVDNNRNRVLYSEIAEFLSGRGVNCKIIENTTAQPIKRYNKYFIDNDEWAILFQHPTFDAGTTEIQTLLISRASKPFSVRIHNISVSWDGYHVKKQKIKKVG